MRDRTWQAPRNNRASSNSPSYSRVPRHLALTRSRYPRAHHHLDAEVTDPHFCGPWFFFILLHPEIYFINESILICLHLSKKRAAEILDQHGRPRNHLSKAVQSPLELLLDLWNSLNAPFLSMKSCVIQTLSGNLDLLLISRNWQNLKEFSNLKTSFKIFSLMIAET